MQAQQNAAQTIAHTLRSEILQCARHNFRYDRRCYLLSYAILPTDLISHARMHSTMLVQICARSHQTASVESIWHVAANSLSINVIDVCILIRICGQMTFTLMRNRCTFFFLWWESNRGAILTQNTSLRRGWCLHMLLNVIGIN